MALTTASNRTLRFEDRMPVFVSTSDVSVSLCLWTMRRAGGRDSSARRSKLLRDAATQTSTSKQIRVFASRLKLQPVQDFACAAPGGFSGRKVLTTRW